MGKMMDNDGARNSQVTLTFWLPERVDALLRERERGTGTSRSDMVRGILRQYLYGLCGAPSPARDDLHTHVRKGKRGAWGGRMPGLGKNTVQVKLSLPHTWSDDLAAIASGAGITSSHHAREVVVTHLFGHAYLPARVMRLYTEAAEQD